jgi:NADH dehydrogenase FAD-containing subunit
MFHTTEYHVTLPIGWQDLKPKYSQLAEDTEADICVIGGGITGLSVAYSLQKSGALLSSQPALLPLRVALPRHDLSA